MELSPGLLDQIEEIVVQRRALLDALYDGNVHADTVLRGGRVVNVVTGEIYPADVCIKGAHILKVGDSVDVTGPETTVVELGSAFVIPGFIDSHTHFESAMLTATEFSRLSIPTGTTTIVSDPHEIGNVLGPIGIEAMARESATLPNRIHTRPPCHTPNVPGVETAGFDIRWAHVPDMLELPSVDGIGENQAVTQPRLVHRHTPEVIDDVLHSTAYARLTGKVVDGNAAAIFGSDLAAHIIAGGTDVSCHETTTKAESLAKLRDGVWVLMREGSTQRNMAECIRPYTEDGLQPHRLCLSTDDMMPNDLRDRGHMNDVVRRTIAAGVDPVLAIQMATIHPATWMGHNEVGALLPGKLADVVVIDGPLEEMNVRAVYLNGEHVAQNNELLIDLPRYTYPDEVKNSVKRGPVTAAELAVPAGGDSAAVRAVGLIPDQNLTRSVTGTLPVADGVVRADVSQDLLHLALVERHGRHGGVGRSFVHGFGMEHGAIAESVAHDCHNIMAMGTSLDDMVIAINRVIEMQGGLALAKNGAVIGDLPLPIAGLITDQMTAVEMADRLQLLGEYARDELGVKVHGPFMHLAFLSLSTSPTWKITDLGLLDVPTYTIIPTVIDGDVSVAQAPSMAGTR
jgi:adenine deaminase